MDIQRQFPDVHWIWGGSISFVYEVHPCIVVKVPKTGDFEKKQFQKELKIYKTFLQHAPCPYVVQCFFHADNGIFLEYMRDVSLSSRIQNHQIRDQKTMTVTKVERLEPLPLRKRWVHDLAQAVAFLESLNLAHGDLRPENVLLDRDQLKLSDFDCTAEIGSEFAACMAPYGRLLNSNEGAQGQPGTPGALGPRTEQFALGSLYYFINYGFEVYGDRCLADDQRDHGPKVVDALQNMEFPRLEGDPLIDNIIDKCWHNKYATVAQLAAQTERLLRGAKEREPNAQTLSGAAWNVDIGNTVRRLRECLGGWWASLRPNAGDDMSNRARLSDRSDGSCHVDHGRSTKDFLLLKSYCQDLDERGLLGVLSSAEPEQLGFTCKWYGHSC